MCTSFSVFRCASDSVKERGRRVSGSARVSVRRAGKSAVRKLERMSPQGVAGGLLRQRVSGEKEL